MSRTTERPAETIVARDAEIRGKVDGSEDLRVFGLVEGSVELSARLIVEERGVVQADVRASEIHVAGFVQGKLEATTLIGLGPTARVQGDLVCPRVRIEPGAQIEGAVRTGAAAVAAEPSERPAARPERIFLGPEPTPASEIPTELGLEASESPRSRKSRVVVKVRRGRQSEVEGN